MSNFTLDTIRPLNANKTNRQPRGALWRMTKLAGLLLLPCVASSVNRQAKRLVANILLGRMDDRTMNTIQDLVTGQNAGRLINVYGEYIHIAGGERPDGTPEDVANEVPSVSMGLVQTLTLLKEATVDAVGNNGSEAKETDVPRGDPIFDIVSQDLVNEAEASIERRNQAVADGGMAEQN